VVLLILFFTVASTSEVYFESHESKSIDRAPVFNSIKLIEEPDRDIWMMNQSHFGSQKFSPKMDRIAIVSARKLWKHG
jgi:hypothetical protein